MDLEREFNERERGEERRKIRENRVSDGGVRGTREKKSKQRLRPNQRADFKALYFPRKGEERNRDPPLSLDRYNILSTAIPYLFYSFPDS